jgi:predicted small secreted protein
MPEVESENTYKRKEFVMSRKTIVVGILVLLVVVVLAGCAPGPNTMADVPNEEGEVAGFWLGLWHGFASPVMFIVSLFNEAVEVYEVHNNGAWYTFGFLLGASAIFGGGSGGAAYRGCRRRWD